MAYPFSLTITSVLSSDRQSQCINTSPTTSLSMVPLITDKHQQAKHHYGSTIAHYTLSGQANNTHTTYTHTYNTHGIHNTHAHACGQNETFIVYQPLHIQGRSFFSVCSSYQKYKIRHPCSGYMAFIPNRPGYCYNPYLYTHILYIITYTHYTHAYMYMYYTV